MPSQKSSAAQGAALQQPPAAGPALRPKPCRVAEVQGTEGPEGLVEFRIDVTEWKRLKLRMGTRDWDEYVWQNIIRRAVMGAVY